MAKGPTAISDVLSGVLWIACAGACLLRKVAQVVSSLLSPFVVAAGAFSVLSAAYAAALSQQPSAPEPKVFEVVARRFAFEPATIEVTEGDTVRLLVRSADGPHGVEIKAFKVKKAVPRAKPGDSPVTIDFVASAPGEYPILCSDTAATVTKT